MGTRMQKNLYTFIILLLLLMTEEIPELDSIKVVVQGVCMLLVALKIMCEKSKKSYKLLAIFSVIVVFALSLFCPTFAVFKVYLLFLLSKNLYFKDALRIFMCAIMSLFTFNILLYLLGVHVDMVEVGRHGENVGHTLGFSHYNTLGFYFMMMFCIFFILYKKRIKGFGLVAFAACLAFFAYLSFKITYSLTSFCCTIIFLIACIFEKKVCNYLEKIKKYGKIAVFPIFYVICINIAIFFHYPNLCRNTFEARFYAGKILFDTFGVGLLGNKEVLNMPFGIPNDCLYSYILSGFGIILSLVFFAIQGECLYKIYKSRLGMLYIFFMLILIYSTMDKFILGAKDVFALMALANYPHIDETKNKLVKRTE